MSHINHTYAPLRGAKKDQVAEDESESDYEGELPEGNEHLEGSAEMDEDSPSSAAPLQPGTELAKPSCSPTDHRIKQLEPLPSLHDACASLSEDTASLPPASPSVEIGRAHV